MTSLRRNLWITVTIFASTACALDADTEGRGERPVTATDAEGSPDGGCGVPACGGIVCKSGQICVSNEDGVAQCVEHPCHLVDCSPSAPNCVLNENGEAVCVSSETACADLACHPWQVCLLDDKGAPYCQDLED